MLEIILLRYHNPENISAILSQPERTENLTSEYYFLIWGRVLGFLALVGFWLNKERKRKDEVVTFLRLLNCHGRQMETVCNRTGNFTQQSALLQHFIWLWHHQARLELLSESMLVVKLKKWEPRSRKTGECGIQRLTINIYIIIQVNVGEMRSRKEKYLGRRKTSNTEYLNICF